MYSIDRFEGDFAVCENEEGEMVNIQRTRLPKSAREGDILVAGARGRYKVDKEATKARQAANADLLRELLGEQ